MTKLFPLQITVSTTLVFPRIKKDKSCREPCQIDPAAEPWPTLDVATRGPYSNKSPPGFNSFVGGYTIKKRTDTAPQNNGRASHQTPTAYFVAFRLYFYCDSLAVCVCSIRSIYLHSAQ